MTKNLLPMAVFVSVLFLTGCNQGDPTRPGGMNVDSAAIDEADVVAKVNGQPITRQTLEMISEANQGANIPREKLIDDLIKHELLYQDAVRKNLESNKEVAERIRFIQRSILSQAAMEDFIANTPITDAEIQKEYEQTYGGSKQEEYKARHILTETEDKAKEVIEKLKGGADFEELAMEYSTGPVGPKGGDLGWFSAQQMVAPFSEAVIALKNGEYSKQPVHTQFGWHVILREDSRAKAALPLEAVKPNIQAQLQRKAIDSHLESLKANAKIEIIPEKPTETTDPAPASEQPEVNSPEFDQSSEPAPPEQATPGAREPIAETDQPESPETSPTDAGTNESDTATE